MTSSLAIFLPLAWRSLREPRETASTVLALGVPREAIAPAALLVVVLNVLLTALIEVLLPPAATDEPQVMLSPLLLAAVLAATLGAFIAGIYRIGQSFGGRGSLPETAVLLILLQFIVVLLQVVEMALALVAPGLLGIYVLAVAFLALWINVNFVAELHGFSLAKSLGVVLLTSFVIAVVGVLLLSLTGMTPEQPA